MAAQLIQGLRFLESIVAHQAPAADFYNKIPAEGDIRWRAADVSFVPIADLDHPWGPVERSVRPDQLSSPMPITMRTS